MNQQLYELIKSYLLSGCIGAAGSVALENNLKTIIKVFEEQEKKHM